MFTENVHWNLPASAKNAVRNELPIVKFLFFIVMEKIHFYLIITLKLLCLLFPYQNQYLDHI